MTANALTTAIGNTHPARSEGPVAFTPAEENRAASGLIKLEDFSLIPSHPMFWLFEAKSRLRIFAASYISTHESRIHFCIFACGRLFLGECREKLAAVS